MNISKKENSKVCENDKLYGRCDDSCCSPDRSVTVKCRDNSGNKNLDLLVVQKTF